jgi:MFS transporter, AAHS family, 3-hydroxyphenylpropionic acid transporter
MTRDTMGRNGMTLLLCSLVALCEGIDLQAAGLAAAGIGAELRPTPDQFGTFFGASTFGLFLGALIGGRLADSFGRKWILVVSVALFGVFSLCTAAAGGIDTLIAARFATGLGLGGTLPLVVALSSEVSSAERKSANVALVYAAMPFGGGLASLLSLLVDADRWRLLFIFGGVLPLLLCPVMALGLRESVPLDETRVLDRGKSGAEIKRGSIAGVFSQGRGLSTVLLWASFFFALLLLYLLLNWLPTLVVGRGLSHAQASAAQIGFNIGGAAAAVLIGRLLETRARITVYVATFLVLPVLLFLVAKSPADATTLISAIFLLGCGTIAAQACLYTIAPTTYPISIRGIGLGAAIAMGRLGSIAGPKLGGYLKAAGHSPAQLLTDIVPLVIVGSICALLLLRARAARGPSAAAVAEATRLDLPEARR